jgi:DNA polymerase-3 subunit beta
MNITCSKDPLLKAVRTAESLLLAKNIGKANILLDASTDTPRVFSTDSETSVVVNLNAAIDQNGSVVVYGRKLSDILSSLPDKDVQLTVNADHLLKIKTTDKSVKALFSLKGLPRSDYAVLPKTGGDQVFRMAQKDLKNMIRKVIFSASSDDMRYVLNGILFGIKRKTLKLVATDGRRLSVVSKDIEGPAQEHNVIISKKVLSELERMLGNEGDCQVGVSENQAFFHFDNIHIISRLIEGDFPDYQQVIPPTHETTVEFKREELMDAVKRISLLVNENFKKITITIKDNKAVFDSADPEIGEAFEEVNLQSVQPALKEDFVISFNSHFLMDVLKVTDTDTLVFLFNKNVNPAVIREKDGEDFLSIIMPMKNT